MKKVYPLNLEIEVYEGVQKAIGKGNVSELVNRLLTEYIGGDVERLEKERKQAEDRLIDIDKQIDRAKRKEAIKLRLRRIEEEVILPEFRRLKAQGKPLNYESFKQRRVKEILGKEAKELIL